jgi:hypothetical protein
MADTNTDYNFDESILDSIQKELEDGLVDKREGNNNEIDPFKDIELTQHIHKELGINKEDIQGDLDDDLNKDDLDNNNDSEDDHNSLTGDDDKTKTENEEDEYDDPYLLALDIIKQEGLLFIPEDYDGELDAETLDYFKEETNKIRWNQLLLEKRQDFSRKGKHNQRLFDYYILSDGKGDMPKFEEDSQLLNKWENFQIDDEENQREIISSYLKDGLDPNSHNYDILAKGVEAKVEEIMTNYEGEEYANKAKEYFVEKHKESVELQLQQAAQLKQQREAEEAAIEESRRRWHNQFQNVIKNKEWSASKKQQILAEQYNEVILDDSPVPIWYAKETMIRNNPELYSVYLDWLTNFNLNTGSFTETNKSSAKSSKETTRKIMNLINKKNGMNKSHMRQSGGRRINSQSDDKIIVNPLDNL